MIANLSTFLINFFLPDNLRYLELIKLVPPKRKKIALSPVLPK